MTANNLDDIFSDLIDHDEEQQAFIGFLESIIPKGDLLLVTDDGRRIGRDAEVFSDDSALADLFQKVRAGGEKVCSVVMAKGRLYALPVEKFNAVLLLSLPGDELDFSLSSCGRQLLLNSVDMAFMKLAEEELAAEKDQFVRQINTLKNQHGKLIEDNYRQYRLNQKKEKEYARKLETEIARQTAELREANVRLEEISRLKSDFLANMSHELRTPMNAIIGFTELLSETELDDEQADYTKTISQSAASLLVLINDILDLAKIEAGKLELEEQYFDLHDLLQNVVAMFRSTAKEKDVTLSSSLDPGLPATVLGDSNRLKQILINLTGNALKFTTEGSVALDVTCERQGEDEVMVRFAVKDTGIGIPAARVEAIFEKFTQADGSTTRKYGGTGLGLAICRQLVDLMRGELAVESIEGQGSSFYFTLPMRFEAARQPAEEQPCKEEAVQQPSGAVGSKSVRVLLVEDNPVNQRLATILIKKQGCEVMVAQDGCEALDKLRDEECDLIFMDVQMPKMDGMEATRKIREIEASGTMRPQYAALCNRGEPIFIVGLTAHARKEDEEACYNAGMNSFLTKPLSRKSSWPFCTKRSGRTSRVPHGVNRCESVGPGQCLA